MLQRMMAPSGHDLLMLLYRVPALYPSSSLSIYIQAVTAGDAHAKVAAACLHALAAALSTAGGQLERHLDRLMPLLLLRAVDGKESIRRAASQALTILPGKLTRSKIMICLSMHALTLIEACPAAVSLVLILLLTAVYGKEPINPSITGAHSLTWYAFHQENSTTDCACMQSAIQPPVL